MSGTQSSPNNPDRPELVEGLSSPFNLGRKKGQCFNKLMMDGKGEGAL